MSASGVKLTWSDRHLSPVIQSAGWWIAKNAKNFSETSRKCSENCPKTFRKTRFLRYGGHKSIKVMDPPAIAKPQRSQAAMTNNIRSPPLAACPNTGSSSATWELNRRWPIWVLVRLGCYMYILHVTPINVMYPSPSGSLTWYPVHRR